MQQQQKPNSAGKPSSLVHVKVMFLLEAANLDIYAKSDG